MSKHGAKFSNGDDDDGGVGDDDSGDVAEGDALVSDAGDVGVTNDDDVGIDEFDNNDCADGECCGGAGGDDDDDDGGGGGADGECCDGVEDDDDDDGGGADGECCDNDEDDGDDADDEDDGADDDDVENDDADGGCGGDCVGLLLFSPADVDSSVSPQMMNFELSLLTKNTAFGNLCKRHLGTFSLGTHCGKRRECSIPNNSFAPWNPSGMTATRLLPSYKLVVCKKFSIGSSDRIMLGILSDPALLATSRSSFSKL